MEELQAALASFVEQAQHPVMLLTTLDEELPIVLRVLDGLDGESPGDVFFIHTEPVTGAVPYVDGVVRAVREQLAEVNVERREANLPELAAPPAECSSHRVDPFDRLRLLVRHMLSWLSGEEHRLVFALLPEHVADRETQARVAGTLVPFRDLEPWMRDLRLILRDDRQAPFVVDGLRRANVTGPMLYTTRVTVGEVADAVAADAANVNLPPARRINALLQCAAMDLALGRLEAAAEKYTLLYQYYDQHNVVQMKASALQGIGEVMARVGNLEAARGRYLQALDVASDARSLPHIMQVAAAIGEIDMRLRAFAEADTSFTLGAGAADKLGLVCVRADLLERTGEARAAAGNLRGAAEAWTQSAAVAREFNYDPRLESVLQHLHDLSSGAGYREVAVRYRDELAEVRARLASQRNPS